ncbi:MAG: helix-turn-helix transcriptional regulator [Cyclobacteriaceae bacterium]
MNNYFAKNLRYLRKKTSQTMEEVATVLGKKKSIIGSYENGQAEPSLQTVIRLADHFNISLWKFVETNLETLPSVIPERGRNIQTFRKKLREIRKLNDEIKGNAPSQDKKALRNSMTTLSDAMVEFSDEMEVALYRQERLERAYLDMYKGQP